VEGSSLGVLGRVGRAVEDKASRAMIRHSSRWREQVIRDELVVGMGSRVGVVVIELCKLGVRQTGRRICSSFWRFVPAISFRFQVGCIFKLK
jgi:hypothetical protein